MTTESIDRTIRDAIRYAIGLDIKIINGAHYVIGPYEISIGDQVISRNGITHIDPIAACVQWSDFNRSYAGDVDYSKPEIISRACKILNVNRFWLHRFYLGYDRGHQVVMEDKDGKEIKDDVSAYGIKLYKEFVKLETLK